MATKSKRVYRMAELIQGIIAQLLRKEVNDPRLRFTTITGVDLSPDGKSATVFFSLLDNTDENIKLAKQAFQNAAGFFRLHLSRMTELRHTPHLHFEYDVSLVVGERVSHLLKDVNED
jgi:ribosome-binding factor A